LSYAGLQHNYYSAY